MKNEFSFKFVGGDLAWCYPPRLSGAYIWISKSNYYHSYSPHYGEDGFVLRDYIVSGEVWDIGYCKYFLEHEEEIMLEAKKFLIKEML